MENKKPFNKIGQPHGLWEAFHFFYDSLWYKVHYIYGKLFGLYQNFNIKGKLLISEYYAR
jgi:hypothetical protein